jgi:hypothetical protein
LDGGGWRAESRSGSEEMNPSLLFCGGVQTGVTVDR